MRESEEEDKFAQEWRKAFEDAQLPPSPVVWSEIESRLDAKSGWSMWRNALIKGSFLLLSLLLISIAYFKWYVPQPDTQAQKKIKTASDSLSPNTHLEPETNQANLIDKSEAKQLPERQAFDTIAKLQSKVSVKDTEVQQQQYSRITHKRTVPPNVNDNFNFANLELQPQTATGLGKENKEDALKPIQTHSLTPESEANKPLELQYLEYNALNTAALSEINSPKIQIDTAAFALFREQLAVRQSSALSLEVAYAQVVSNLNQSLDYQNYLKDYLHLHNIQNVIIDDFFVGLEEQVQFKNAFSLSARLVYAFKNRLKLRTGLVYHAIESTLQTNALFVNEQNERVFALTNQLSSGDMRDVNIARAITTNASYNPDVLHDITLNNYNESKSIALAQRTQYLKIPLEIGNTFSLGRNFSHTLWAGLHLDVLVGSSTYHASLNNPTSKVNAHKMLNTSFSLRWQGNYHLNKQWILFVEPFYERGIGNFAKPEKYLQIRPQNYGIGIGINRKL